MIQYNFEWDPEKAKLNRKEHKVSFEEAATVFQDPRSITLFDEDHSKKEERWITMGLSTSGRLILVCHTFMEESEEMILIRMYSARKATSSEKEKY